MLRLLVLLVSGAAAADETAQSVVGKDLDKTIDEKLNKVEDITAKVDGASKHVLDVQKKNWYPGSPETVKASKQLQALLDRAQKTNLQLQMGLTSVKSKESQAQLHLGLAKGASDAACGTAPCDLAAVQAADLKLNEFKASLQDSESLINMEMGDNSQADKKALYVRTRARKKLFVSSLMKSTMEELQICKKQLGHKITKKTMTPCQLALNTTVHAQFSQILLQQLVDACSSAAEKLGVTIKRAEELVRPLEMGEQRLFQLHGDVSWPMPQGWALLALTLAVFGAASLLTALRRPRQTLPQEVMDEELLEPESEE